MTDHNSNTRFSRKNKGTFPTFCAVFVTLRKAWDKTDMKSFRKQFRFWGYRLAVLLLLYVVSYAILTRTSMWVLSHDPAVKESTFYYIPFHGWRIAQSPFLDPLQRTLAIFYMPLERIDYRITGAKRNGIPMLDIKR